MDDPELLNLDLEEAGYQAGYSRLVSVAPIAKRTIPVEDPKLYLAQCVSNMSITYPGKVEGIISQNLPLEVSSRLNSYMQSAGVSLR